MLQAPVRRDCARATPHGPAQQERFATLRNLYVRWFTLSVGAGRRLQLAACLLARVKGMELRGSVPVLTAAPVGACARACVRAVE